MKRLVRFLFLLLLGSFSTFPAIATDGVLEINQACVASGCIPGDAPGFPVTLLVEGSYRLTSNLVVPTGAPAGITIAARADLDLNGFSIRGPGTCGGTGGSVACTGLSGYGIFISDTSANVRNGTITGLTTGVGTTSNTLIALSDLLIQSTGTGILGFETQLTIDRVRVQTTSGSCIFISNIIGSSFVQSIRSSFVADCHDSGIAADPGHQLTIVDTGVENIGALGITTSDHAVIRNVRVNQAGSDGLVCGAHCIVEDSHFSSNNGRGLVAGAFSEVTENGVGPNGNTAIVAGDGSTVSRNTVAAFDAATGNRRGIQCGAGCGVFENVTRNGTVPIDVGAGSRTGRNVMSLYQTPPALGVSAGDNLCSGTNC